MIACLSIPFFAAAVEQRADRSLGQRPLVAGGQPWEPRPVFGFSWEAAQKGVAPGLPLRQAHVYAPEARFIPAHPPDYSQASAEVADLLGDLAGGVESDDLWRPPARPQPHLPLGSRSLPAQFYLELGGLPAGEALRLAREVGASVRREVQLEPAIGLAEQRFTAHVAAARARTGHILPATAGSDGTFLAGCSINYLPLDGESHRRLRLLGINTLGELAALPLAALQSQFGPAIRRLRSLARGEREAPLPLRPAEPVEQLAYYFEEGVVDRQALDRLLVEAAAELAGRLKEANSLGRRLHWQWEAGDGQSGGDSLTLRQATADSRRLATALQELAGRTPFTAGITNLAISLGGLCPATAGQLSLFAAPGRRGRAGEAAARLAARHGAGCFAAAMILDRRHPLPEYRFLLQAYDLSLE
jgi:nucleotidyltransferase/DNA polymerase involved in DNA repair